MSLYGRPYGWLWFAVVLFGVPLAALAARSGGWEEIHPALNAMLNGTSGVFLFAGYVAIRRRNIALHRQCMLTALSASALFLLSYVVRFLTTGAHKYPGDGIDKIVYLTILFSHMILAMGLLPLVLITAARALRGDFARHRRIARWTFPLWAYVSVTGVVVYFMLYQLPKWR